MTAAERWPRAAPWWLALAEEWVARTGADPADIAEHEMPCLGPDGCGGVFDRRSLAEVASHAFGHEPFESLEGITGQPVADMAQTAPKETP